MEPDSDTEFSAERLMRLGFRHPRDSAKAADIIAAGIIGVWGTVYAAVVTSGDKLYGVGSDESQRALAAETADDAVARLLQ